jgi:hypothetical protein
MPGIIDVVDAVEAEVGARWQPSAPDELVRKDFVITELTALVGRRVWLFHRNEEQVGKAARGVDLMEYRVSLVVAERYTAQGEMPKEWLDERTRWVNDTIVGPLGDERRRPVLQANAFARECWPQRAQVQDGFNPEDGKKFEKTLFVLVEIDYRRLVRKE